MTSAARQHVVESENRLVDTGDGRIAYRVLGSGGPAVVVVQPFWQSMDDAIEDHGTFITELAREFRVVLHDRRGTGASERHPVRLTHEAMLNDIFAVMTAAGIERAVIIGMAESAPLAVHAAARRPDRVARLALIDPTLRPITGPGSTMLLYSLRSRPRAGLRVLASSLVKDEAEATALAALMARTVDGATAAILYEEFLNADAVNVLEHVLAPALFAYGVRERVTSDDEVATFQTRMRDAHIGTVEGAAGSPAALREAWVQLRAFIGEAGGPRPLPVPPPRGSGRRGPGSESNSPGPKRPRTRQPARPVAVPDYVPAGPPPNIVRPPLRRVPPAPRPVQRPAPRTVPAHTGRWGPPPHIPDEAVKLNRQGIDYLLIGRVEEALTYFQRALEVAPGYDDAAINHRELLTRLVQRRVAEWQNKQAEEVIAARERRTAQRSARRRRRWLKLPFAA